MNRPKGRPPIGDEPALRRIAEHIIETEERGERCTVRAAIVRTCTGRAPGNSQEAALRRLQRKWRESGQALLAELREQRARARRRTAPAPGLGLETSARLGTLAQAVRDLERMRLVFQVPDEIRRALQLSEEARRAFQSSEEVRRVLQSSDQLRPIIMGAFPTQR